MKATELMIGDWVMNIHCFSDVFVHELQHALRLCGVDKEITTKED